MYDLVDEGGVINLISASNKLTRRILLQQDDWADWSECEFIQLNQYAKQHIFGEPCKVRKQSAVFNLIWTYVINELDGRKKARCTCDGSTRGGQVRVLDHTFANSIIKQALASFMQLQPLKTLCQTLLEKHHLQNKASTFVRIKPS